MTPKPRQPSASGSRHASANADATSSSTRGGACRLALVAALLVAACGDAPDSAAAPAGGPAASGTRAAAAFSTEGIESGDVAALLAALDRRHGQVRGNMGAHRIRVKTTFDLQPTGDPPTSEPAVDERRPMPQHVEDELELLWLTQSVHVPRFSLTQSNDHDRGRDVVVDGESIYTRQRNRTWFVGPVQSDVFELWLDDAQRSVHDVVALAAVQLKVDAARDGESIVLALSRAPTADPSRLVDDPRAAWRKNATIDEVAGTVTLDTAGVWLSAKLEVGYSMPGPDGRPLVGRVTLDASRESVAAETALPIPTDAQPLQERTRYDAERTRLLDGLAGG